MVPVLFKIGPFVITGYGVLLTSGFALGLWLSLFRTRGSGIKKEIILDLFLIVLLSSVFGSRFFYVVFHLEEFRGGIWEMVNPVQSTGQVGIAGLSMVGGILLAIFSGILYLYIKKANIWKVADVVAPAFPLGLAVTRIGCFLNGCCFGKPTDSFCGVVFPHDSPAGYFFPDTPLYPSQLFSSFFGAAIFLVLIFLDKRKKFDGFTFWLMVMLYSIARFVVDLFRYYEESMVFLRIGNTNFSINQLVVVFLFLTSLLAFSFLRKSKG
ncbi:MAG: hypothetical protein AMJ90_02190 [candidate division Zixibacteria bacterium SM23_73_2]|nr:MAG: hypothetical protein AMJ90_02190 [candidate division Zixibacteria bacterium SM23_73_2]